MVFPILWTLDPLSPGFNFYPLSLVVIPRPAPGAPFRASSCVFLLAVPPTLFAADLPAYSDTVCTRQCCRVLVVRQGGAQCDSNQEPRPCQRDLRVSSQLLFPLFSLFLSLPFSLFSSFSIFTRWDAILSTAQGDKNQLSPTSLSNA